MPGVLSARSRAHDRKAGKEEKASRRDLIGTLAENAELQKVVAQNAQTIEQLKNALEDTVTKAEVSLFPLHERRISLLARSSRPTRSRSLSKLARLAL